MATVAVDFDGVIHSYEEGWADGTIYGGLVPGTTSALRNLMRGFAVYVLTCRTPLEHVAKWITLATEIPAVADQGTLRFWHERDRILVTGRKLPAIAYIDDRAVAFRDWGRALSDVAAIHCAATGRARP
ncbi:hypothetical protein [Microbispora sp. NPDC049125]|uniref:hypothetical protein n=1 Tax=Microbispora sp. NPDC049125 TaxID=3154929 RepID=UPI0034661234